MQNRRIKDFARRLVELSTEDGKLSPARVDSVLKTLAAKPPRHHLAIVREYRRAVERFQREHTLEVESATEVSAGTLSSLVAEYSKRYDRELEVVSKINPALIAGMRLRVGDDVYDLSVRGRLAALSPT